MVLDLIDQVSYLEGTAAVSTDRDPVQRDARKMKVAFQGLFTCVVLFHLKIKLRAIVAPSCLLAAQQPETSDRRWKICINSQL